MRKIDKYCDYLKLKIDKIVDCKDLYNSIHT